MSTHVNNHTPTVNLVDSMASLGSFVVLRRALDVAGLSVMLSASGNFNLHGEYPEIGRDYLTWTTTFPFARPVST